MDPKKLLIDQIKKASDAFWAGKGAKFGTIQTVAEIDGGKSDLSVLTNKPETRFKVHGTTIRTRGYSIYCELDVTLFKVDGTEYRGSSIFGSYGLGVIVGEG